MSLTIWKYSINLTQLNDVVSVPMKYDAKILTVDAQNDELCIWAIVLPDSDHRDRRFRIAGTGHPLDVAEAGIDVPAEYIGTAHFRHMGLVFHVFDLGYLKEGR